MSYNKIFRYATNCLLTISLAGLVALNILNTSYVLDKESFSGIELALCFITLGSTIIVLIRDGEK